MKRASLISLKNVYLVTNLVRFQEFPDNYKTWTSEEFSKNIETKKFNRSVMC